MLFNSYEFLFAFLPITLVVYFALGRVSRSFALGWIIVASVVFYAWWRPMNVLIIAPSIVVNYLLARRLQVLAQQGKATAAKTTLLFGIAFNIAFLGYFKYANFALEVAHDVFGTEMVLRQIVLPLGISFITFQKIAFLIDVHARRVEAFGLRDFCLFVLFFPQLIAGPIVHYREVVPQFQRIGCTFERRDVVTGLTLLTLGLFKKVILADRITPPAVAAIFQQAEAGQAISLIPAWLAAVGFTLQIYFDFSGYTDMALGTARLFGIRLPPNFDSPLKATSIIEFWQRWHITLTRFLTSYVYNPVALAMTRRRLRLSQGRRDSVSLLIVPIMLTMLLSGLWHGAGYTFLLWGALHGVFLSINHGWRMLLSRRWRDSRGYARVMRPTGFVLTSLCVVASMVVFRSPSIDTAAGVFRGMLGMNGLALPGAMYDRLIGIAPRLGQFGVTSGADIDGSVVKFAAWVSILIFIAVGCPNSLSIMSRYEPALDWRPVGQSDSRGRWALKWRPSLMWGLAIGIIAAIATARLGGNTEFLYWQF